MGVRSLQQNFRAELEHVPAARPFLTTPDMPVLTLAGALVTQGVPAEDVLLALCRAAGLPRAPPALLRAVRPNAALLGAFERLRKQDGVPFQVDDGVVHVAFSDPDAALAASASSRTPIRAFLALRPELDAAMAPLLRATTGETLAAPAAISSVLQQDQRMVDATPTLMTPAPPSGPLPKAPQQTLDGATQVTPPPAHVLLAKALARAQEQGGIPLARNAIAEPRVGSANDVTRATPPPRLQQKPSAPPAVAPAAIPGALDVGLPPSTFPPGRLKVDRKLGAGGMAEVVLAHDATLGRLVAVKKMLPGMGEDEGFVQRFLREVKNASALDHPNIVPVLAYGQLDGGWCMVCEYLDGGTVQALLRKVGALPTAVVALLAEGLLNALGYAHAHGVIHRDLKPANVLLGLDGGIKLADFGIARSSTDTTLTATAALIGTPAYMSPEQVQAHPIDQRGDLFSVGIVIYELLAGANPFNVPDSPSATFHRIMEVAIPPVAESVPQVHPLLDSLLAGLLEKSPQHRFPSAKDALAVLQPLLDTVHAAHPQLMRQLLVDPAATCARLRRQDAAAEFERGRAQWESRPQAAAISVYRASVLTPEDPAIQDTLRQVCERTNARFGAVTDPRALETRDAVEKAPNAPGTLKRAADVHRAQGYLFQSSIYLRRYIRLKPMDSLARTQLQELLGPDLTPPHLAAPPSMSTQALVEGIKTGGFDAVRPQLQALGEALPPLVQGEPEAHAADSFTTQLWELVRNNQRLVWTLAVVALVGGWGVRTVGRFIDRSVTSTKTGLKDLPDKVMTDPSALLGGASPLLEGERCLRGGDHAGASAAFSQVIAQEKDDRLLSRAFLGRGKAQLSLGKPAEAAADLKTALDKMSSSDPQRPDAELLLRTLRP